MAHPDFTLFFDLSIELFTVVGFDGYFKTLNQAWTKTLGWTNDELSAKPFIEFVHPDDREKTLLKVEKLVKGVPIKRFENRYVHKDGSYRHLRWSGIGIPESNLIYATASDITSEIEQQTSMIALARLSSVGEMAAGIAHEINNPLAIIIGKSALLRRKITKGVATSEELGTSLKTMEETCQRIVRIINGLRSLSHNAESDPFTMTMLKTIVEDTLQLCQERFRKFNVEMKIAPCHAMAIECRAAQIGNVILDLLVNALDAVRDTHGAWVALDFEELDTDIKIMVTDSGAGIPPEIAEKIMEPFFTTKEVGKGTGLGLSISKGRIEAHGGTFQLDKKSPHTRFVITLPKKQVVEFKKAA